MPHDLQSDIQLLDKVLTDVLERLGPDGHTQLCDRLLEACTRSEDDGFDAASEQIARLDLIDIRQLIKSATLRFHLRNQAEKVAIVQINRRRQREATPDNPRTESIAEALYKLKSRGISAGAARNIIGRIDIQPTLTAHPTESRRRTLLRKQRDIADHLFALHDPSLLDADRRRHETAIRQAVLLLYGTDEVRVGRLSVYDEIEASLYFLTTAIWEAVPSILRDVADAFEMYFGTRLDVPPIVRYRTWIGGDRDGNPLVTPEMTRQSLRLHRRSAIDLYREKLNDLVHLLSLSDRRIAMPPELVESVQPELLERWMTEDTVAAYRHEPFRLKLIQMQARLDAAIEDENAYDAAAFQSDLETLARSLEQIGLTEIVESSGLGALHTQASVFGFHLAGLDIRQHSAVHEKVVHELLAAAGVCDDYETLSEERRVDVLSRAMDDGASGRVRFGSFTEPTRDLLEVFDIVKRAAEHDPRAVGCYIISMAGTVSDVLEVLWLARITGCHAIDVVPLFETIDDLTRAPGLLDAMFASPVYRAHVESRGRFQEIMLGYSDSNKDGGYLMSGMLLHTAQSELARVCRNHSVHFRFFHGRGGTVGRGGGRSNRAIMATPPDSRCGRIRMTEQGEVVSFRYALSDIAHRHLEQLTSAMIVAESEASESEPGAQATGFHEESRDSHHESPNAMPSRELIAHLGRRSMETYRALIDDPEFWTWFTQVSPIAHISALPIASRPVSRDSKQVHFENLRAIPWVFSWTQMRFNVPGWYGIGTALSEAMDQSKENTETLERWYRDWEHFRTLIDNAQQEMARARLIIAERYDELAETSFYDRIAAEFDRARAAILGITGQNEILDNNPVIQKSIRERNRATDLLNLLQLELLNRHRRADDDEMRDLRPALFASINGIASAMQSTG